MAYLRKDDLVIIRNADTNIQARVVDMQFRRFRRSWKDKKTGKTKDGEKLLVLRDKYATEFNGEWVNKMLAESKAKREGA